MSVINQTIIQFYLSTPLTEKEGIRVPQGRKFGILSDWTSFPPNGGPGYLGGGGGVVPEKKLPVFRRK